MRGLLAKARPLVDAARPVVAGGRILLVLVSRLSRSGTVALLTAAALVGAAPVALAVVAGHLVGRLPEVARTGDLDPATQWWLIAVPVVLVVQELGRQGLGVVGGSLGRRVDGSLRSRVLAVALRPVGIAHLEEPDLQRVIASARNLSPLSMTPGDAVPALGWSLAGRVQGVVAVAVLAWYAPALAVIGLAWWCVIQLFTVRSVIRLITSSAFGMLSLDVLYLRELALTRPAAKELRVFGLGDWLADRYDGIARAKIDAGMAARRGQMRGFAVIGSLVGVGLGGGLALAGTAGIRGTFDVTATAVVVGTLLRLFSIPATPSDLAVAFGTFSVAAIEAAEALPVGALGRASDAAPSSPAHRGELAFRAVRFGYGGDVPAVLDGLDLVIPAGQRLAVVGLNGAGKTTLVKLLCRLYDPDAGAIHFGGDDLRGMDVSAWRAHLGVLFQDFVRWQLPARDNVTLGAPGVHVSAEELDELASLAGAASVVADLPAGWDTPLGAGRAGGVDLSGGQWQRVALTRALRAVRHGARVLVLDEPTANLDPAAEQDFFDSVLDNDALRTGPDGEPITTILISHRFVTVRHADRIVVLEEGRVVEDGTHDELVALGGRYARLFEAQAAAFEEVA